MSNPNGVIQSYTSLGPSELPLSNTQRHSFFSSAAPAQIYAPYNPFAEAPRCGRGLVMSVRHDMEPAFAEAVKIASTFRMEVLFAIQEREVLNLDDGMELFRILDTSRDNKLSRAEVKDGCLGSAAGFAKGNKEAQTFLEKYSNTPLGLLQNEAMIGELLLQRTALYLFVLCLHY